MTALIEEAHWLEHTVGVRALELGAIRVQGDDARTWLNGQITNDVSETRAGDSVYALLLDVNGRILADVYALDLGEGYDLLVAGDRVEALCEHLDGFIVMEDVELEARTLTVISAQGPSAASLGGGFSCDRLGRGGVDLLEASWDEVVKRAEELGGGAVSAGAWDLARLRAGRPALGLDFDATLFPQEAGLAELAVSFTKGCYVGQEVVCMLENRGRLRRRLVQVRADALPAPGSRLMYDVVEVGQVRSGAVDEERGGAWALAVVKRVHARVGAELLVQAESKDDTSTITVTVRKLLGGRADATTL